jgi:hypothetical protein
VKLSRVEVAQNANYPSLPSRLFRVEAGLDIDADYQRQVVTIGSPNDTFELPMSLCVMWPMPATEEPPPAVTGTASMDVPCLKCAKLFPSLRALAGHQRHCKAEP